MTVEQTIQRFLRFRQWEVSEFSMAGYLTRVAVGDRWVVGLPVFPSRVFRHSEVYVRAEEITEPAQLASCRIGVPESAETATVYMRALLAEEWGGPPTTPEWVQAGANEPGRRKKAEVYLPEGANLTRVPERSLDEMLLDGDLDAVFRAHTSASYEPGDPRTVLIPRCNRSRARVQDVHRDRANHAPCRHPPRGRRAEPAGHRESDGRLRAGPRSLATPPYSWPGRARQPRAAAVDRRSARADRNRCSTAIPGPTVSRPTGQRTRPFLRWSYEQGSWAWGRARRVVG